MTNTSSTPITIDGNRLDTWAYNVETLSNRHMVPAQRFSTVKIPGRDGLAIDFEDAVDEGRIVLKIWLVDCDENGNFSYDRRAQFDRNLDFFLNLIAETRGRVIEVQQTMADGTIRRADGIITEAVTPDMFGPLSAKMALAIMLPNSWWEDTATADFSFTDALTPTTTTVTILTGATAPIDDARFLVKGPVTNPRVIDLRTGAYAQLTRTLSGTEYWLFDAKTRVSRYGTSFTLNSADTAGTDGWADTSYTGAYKILSLRPYLVGGNREVRVRLTGTSGSSATALSIRAKRKYA